MVLILFNQTPIQPDQVPYQPAPVPMHTPYNLSTVIPAVQGATFVVATLPSVAFMVLPDFQNMRNLSNGPGKGLDNFIENGRLKFVYIV